MSRKIYPQLNSNFLKENYSVKEKSCEQVSRQIGCSSSAVWKRLKQFDIPRHRQPDLVGGSRHYHFNPTVNLEKIKALREQGLSLTQIAAQFGCSYPTLVRRLRNWGIRGNELGRRPRGYRSYNFRKDADSKKISDLYHEGKTPREIAGVLGISFDLVYRRLQGLGIHSKITFPLTCRDGHKVRSSLERIVDDWLSIHGLEHQYEPRLGKGSRMLADFLVGSVYIEVFGIRGKFFHGYESRRLRKEAFYKKEGLQLIPLEVEDFKEGRFFSRKLSFLIGAKK